MKLLDRSLLREMVVPFMIMIWQSGVRIGKRSDEIGRVAIGLQKIPQHQPIAAGVSRNRVTQGDRITERHDSQDRFSRAKVGHAKQPD